MAYQRYGTSHNSATLNAPFLNGAIFALALIPLVIVPVIPTLDFYNHIARYYVLAHINANPELAKYYAAHWTILPNLGLDLVGTGLMKVLPATLVPHLIAILIFALQYSGVLALHRALGGKAPVMVAILAAGLLYSYIFVWGFSNFLCGLGLAFLAAAWWVVRRDRPLIALPVAMVLALAIFFFHGLAFAFYGVLIGGLELGLWLRSSDRRFVQLVRSGVLLGLQAVIPACLFLLAPTSKGEVTSAAGSLARYANHKSELFGRLIHEMQHRVLTVIRVGEGPSYVFDAAIFFAVVAVVGWLMVRRQISLNRTAWPAIALFALMCAIVPPAMFGVGYVADRVPLALALLLVASLQANFASTRWRMGALAVLATLLVVRLGGVAVDWWRYRQDYASFERATAPIEKGAMVAELIVQGSDPRDGFKPRCQMYTPLTIIQRGAITPLFAIATQQPLSLKGPLLEARDERASETSQDLARQPDYADNTLSQLTGSGLYRYVLMCGRSRLHRPLPSNLELAGASGPIEVYRIRPG